jgi:signal transduction histidine kinase
MQPLKILLLTIALSATLGTAAQTDAPVDEMQMRWARAEQKADRLQTALIVLTVVYIFVYIMGRRRLMRKIWSRNRQLKEALDKAEEADRMKTAFIRNMSHEIRTPLNAINGFSQLLNDPSVELNKEERTDMVDRISRSVDSITNTVAELLDMSEGESSHDEEEVHVNELCARMLEELKKQNDKDIFLMYDSELDEDFTVMSSTKNLERILRRILGNALKFTEKGSITLHCEKLNGQLLISIADTGIGIDPAKREEIFKTFVQLDEDVDGIGLGLTLSRRLARQLGGDVVLDDNYMGGARFLFTLPLK